MVNLTPIPSSFPLVLKYISLLLFCFFILLWLRGQGERDTDSHFHFPVTLFLLPYTLTGYNLKLKCILELKYTHTYPTIFNLPPLSKAFYSLKRKKNSKYKWFFLQRIRHLTFLITCFQRNLWYIFKAWNFTPIFFRNSAKMIFSEDCSINYFVLTHFLKKAWFYILLWRGSGLLITNFLFFLTT